jgi:hypothetical protein
MEYIEKGKYELLMSLRNNESTEVIDFLRKYYDDMIKIVSLTYKNELIHKVDVKIVKYILNFYYEDSGKNSFGFSNQQKLIEFYEKNKNKIKITVIEIHDLDPEDIFRPNIEEDINEWLQRNKYKKM